MTDELPEKRAAWQSPDAVFLVCATLFLASGAIADNLLFGAPKTIGPLTLRHIPPLFYGLFIVFVITFARSVASETSAFRLLCIARAGAVRNALKGIALGVVCFFAVLPVSYLSIRLYTHLTGVPPDAQDVLRVLIAPGNHPVAVAFFLLYAVLLAPICEEIVYRCVLLQTLLRDASPRRAGAMLVPVALSSLFFGLMHLDVVRFPALTLLGVVFAIAFLKTKTLVIPIAAHITFNAINLTLAALAQRFIPS